MEREFLMHLDTSVVNTKFSHIYVEKDVLYEKMTQEILAHFPHSEVIIIQDYRDVFNRKKQSHALQKVHQNLILAKKKDAFLYPASPVCQSFDNRYFYYSSSMMNCVYDCEYCFLKGMYPSGNLVVFVNLDDFFEAVEEKLSRHPVYLCVSYDTDMLALESVMHNAEKWSAFCEKHDNLSIEIRTKGTYALDWKKIKVNESVILAFTLSPEYVAQHYEHGTPDLKQRIKMIQDALEIGYPCRICFDPILVFPGWEKAYLEMLNMVREKIDFHAIRDFSIGSFRISKNYLSSMRKQYPHSAVLQYPYVCDKGFYHLPQPLQTRAEKLVLEYLKKEVDEDRIYQWEEESE